MPLRSVGLSIVVISCFLMGGVGWASTGSKKPLPSAASVAEFCHGFDDLIAQRQLLLEVTQCETQRGLRNTRALVVQSKDPVRLALDRAAPENPPALTMEQLYFGPLGAYRDAVRPIADTVLKRVDVLVLAFRGPDQIVYEMKTRLMRRYLAGDLTDAEFADKVSTFG